MRVGAERGVKGSSESIMTYCHRHTNTRHAKRDTGTTVGTKEYKRTEDMNIYFGKIIRYQILQGRASQSSEVFEASKQEPRKKRVCVCVVGVNESAWVIHPGSATLFPI